MCGLSAPQYILAALSLIAAELIRPESIIKTALYLICVKEAELTVSRTGDRETADASQRSSQDKQHYGVRGDDV